MLIYSRYNINGGFLMKKIISFALVLSMLLLVLCSCGSKKTIAKIEVENYGTITVELYPDIAPITVKNFVNLAKKGFYNGLTFHRIMDGFMIQGGDPLGNGTGGNTDSQGNRLTIKGEFTANGVNNTLSHKRGVISMARAQDYNSASSQFFIMHKDAAYLDGAYAAFGQVTSGMEVVDKICADAKPIDGNGSIPAENQPKIISITIE
jgi:peptidyl-prolyl cis-trans isomerase B (cyclophilin B)